MDELVARMLPIYAARIPPDERRRRLGAMALAADTVDPDVRRAVLVGRLVGNEWPARSLLVTAVDAATGARRVLDRSSGVGLVDAVAASSAVPGVWPPVTIGGARYIDGGVWSVTNADLATGCDRVLVLAPIVDPTVAGRRRPHWPPWRGSCWCVRTPPRSRRSGPMCSTPPPAGPPPGPGWPRVGPRPHGWATCSPGDADRRPAPPPSVVPVGRPRRQPARPEAATTARAIGRTRPRSVSHPSSPMAS